MTPVTISVSTTGIPTHHHGLQIRLPDLEPVLFRQSCFRPDYQCFCIPEPGCPDGTIYVNSSPAGASAILDNGYDYLTTDGTFNAVSIGLHNVRVSKSGYRLYSTNIEVKPGGTSNVYANRLSRTGKPGPSPYLQIRSGQASTWTPSTRDLPPRSSATSQSVLIR